jgi:hypothetical protein
MPKNNNPKGTTKNEPHWKGYGLKQDYPDIDMKNPDNLKLIKIIPSSNPNFRYEAIIETPSMLRYHVKFGLKSDQIFKDTTRLKLYENENTSSAKIRETHIKKIFARSTKHPRYSPFWFELVYLYSYPA